MEEGRLSERRHRKTEVWTDRGRRTSVGSAQLIENIIEGFFRHRFSVRPIGSLNGNLNSFRIKKNRDEKGERMRKEDEKRME